MKKQLAISMMIGLGIFLPIVLKASPESEGRDFAKTLHNRGYQDASNEINSLKQQASQNPNCQNTQSKTSELEKTFEQNFDQGKKGDDPLKSYFGQKNVEAGQHKKTNQPTVADAEQLLKQKHQFKISGDDPLLKKYQEVSDKTLNDKEAVFQKGQPPVQPVPALTDKTVTCRQGVAPTFKSCVKRLKTKLVPQEPLVKRVSAYFTARCYNYGVFAINLKTGKIDLSQCENYGIVNTTVDNPIGEPDYPDRVTVQLIHQQHIGEAGVRFDSGHMTPSYANGFQVSFGAFQPKTGRKKSHRNNKNNVRGGYYIWNITMPRKPKLETYWEGCEELERQEQEQMCELVEREQSELNETRTVPEYPPITAPFWKEDKGFLCGGGREIDECTPLLEKKCEQIHSQCAVFKKDICIEHENTFRCGVPDYQKTDGLSFQNGELSFLPGSGRPAFDAYSPADFVEAGAHFSALTEMGKNMQEGLGGIGGDPNNPSIFQGQCRQCKISMLPGLFRDCCRLKGMLSGLFGGCTEEEKQLAVAAVKNKRCVKIGRYCHKKRLKICVERRDSYCCYGSQLARILQEIAHQQLGISWGSADNPHCDRLTVSQLSQLNFDTPFAQQKLSEIFAEIEAGASEKFNNVQKEVAGKNLQEAVKEWAVKEEAVQNEAKKRATNKAQTLVEGEKK